MSENKTYVYANSFQFHVGITDFAINFQMINGESQIVQECEVHVSPVAIKLLVRALSFQLQAYEARFGRLPDITVESAPPQDECAAKPLQ
jgi:hypothetical protein